MVTKVEGEELRVGASQPAFRPEDWKPGQRVVGAQAVAVARRHFPDLFTRPPPAVVRLPPPPHIEADWDADRRVDFLVTAYVSFLRVHAAPQVLHPLEQALQHSQRAKGRAWKALRTKLLNAARVMAGEDWMGLASEVEAGKLPTRIQPHAWLLWQMEGCGLAAPLKVDQVFSARKLLNGKALRVYVHADHVAIASICKHYAKPDGNTIEEIVTRRENHAYQKGFHDGPSLTALLFPNDSILDLARVYARLAELEEQQYAQAVRAGTWVWGRLLSAEGGKKPRVKRR